jgi:hypothetical protein
MPTIGKDSGACDVASSSAGSAAGGAWFGFSEERIGGLGFLLAIVVGPYRKKAKFCILTKSSGKNKKAGR